MIVTLKIMSSHLINSSFSIQYIKLSYNSVYQTQKKECLSINFSVHLLLLCLLGVDEVKRTSHSSPTLDNSCQAGSIPPGDTTNKISVCEKYPIGPAVCVSII